MTLRLHHPTHDGVQPLLATTWWLWGKGTPFCEELSTLLKWHKISRRHILTSPLEYKRLLQVASGYDFLQVFTLSSVLPYRSATTHTRFRDGGP
jgi:hypothetical protein